MVTDCKRCADYWAITGPKDTKQLTFIAQIMWNVYQEVLRGVNKNKDH